MKKYLSGKSIILFLLFLLVFIQVFRIDKSTVPADPQKDFISVTSADPKVAGLLKAACYDCHSSQPAYPWYTNIAPVSWWVKHHINEGQQELNFSEWAAYSEKRKDHKLEECIEMLEEGEMPLGSYTWMHREARLTDDQKLRLVEFFKAVKDQPAAPAPDAG